VTWRRLQASHASPQQLAALVIHCAQHQQQQQQQGCSQHDSSQLAQHLATLSVADDGEIDLQQQQPQQAAAPAGTWLRKSAHTSSCEGIISCFPACKPQPSTARKAQQLLAQGRPVAALLRLCPASSSLLLTYAAQARNAALLQQLIALRVKSPVPGFPAIFPESFMDFPALFKPVGDGWFACLPTALMAASAAVRQRWPDGLRILLAAKEPAAIKYIARPLLRLAATHSDAACLEVLLTYAAATGGATPAPEHLVIAAGRGLDDVHAAGVVALLLQELQQRRQLAAKWLRPAYAAACSSGNVAVLLQILQAAAGMAAAERQVQWRQWHRRQHVLAVLLACAEAGNAAVWQQMLDLLCAHSSSSSSSKGFSWGRSTSASSGSSGSSGSIGLQQAVHQQAAVDSGSSANVSSTSTSSSSSCSGIPGPQQETDQLAAAVLLPGLHLSCLLAEDWLSLLHGIWPRLAEDDKKRTHATVLRNQQVALVRCSMADQLWRCLQEDFPAVEVAVWQLLQSSCSWQVLGAGIKAKDWPDCDQGDVMGPTYERNFTEQEWRASCSLAFENEEICRLHQQWQQIQKLQQELASGKQQLLQQQMQWLQQLQQPQQLQQLQQQPQQLQQQLQQLQQQHQQELASFAASTMPPSNAAAAPEADGSYAQLREAHAAAVAAAALAPAIWSSSTAPTAQPLPTSQLRARAADVQQRSVKTLNCMLFISRTWPVERLLWLHNHGLLYGRITQEMLLHAFIRAAGEAAGNLQYRESALYCRLAHCPQLNAAAAPVLLSVKSNMSFFGSRAAANVHAGRVLAACQAADRYTGLQDMQQQLQQLQHLEKLQNLAGILEHVECPFDVAGHRSRCFSAAHTLCSVPGACVHRVNPAAATAPAASTATAAADVATPADAAAAAGSAVQLASPAAGDNAAAAAAPREWLAASTPHGCNAKYALLLGDELGVPVFEMKLRRWQASKAANSSNISRLGVHSTDMNSMDAPAQEELEYHLVVMRCGSQLQQDKQQQQQLKQQQQQQLLTDLDVQQQGDQQQEQSSPQQTLLLQQPQEQPVFEQQAARACQQQQQQQQRGCGPAPLWQLSLLAVLQATGGSNDRRSRIFDDRLLHMDGNLTFFKAFEPLPDAMLQQLTLAFAGRCSISVDGQRSFAPTLGCSAEQQNWQEGLNLATAAVRLQRPRLLQWTMEQPGLWRPCTLPRTAMLDDRWMIGCNVANCQGPRLQADSIAELQLACPLVAGLHLPQPVASAAEPAAAAAAATAAAQATPGFEQGAPPAAAAAAGAAGAASRASNDAQLAAESAMMLLQLEPAYKPSLLSMWIAQHLHAFNDTSKDWLLGSNSSSSSGSLGHARCMARTKAVLAAVAAAPQVPAGAEQLTRKALQKVLDVGDADLTALLLMWACKLEPHKGQQQQPQQQDEAAAQQWWLQPEGLQELMFQQLEQQLQHAI
jgi:hypothetical protein